MRVVMIGALTTLGLLVLGGAAYLFGDRGPASYGARYRRAVDARLKSARGTPDTLIAEADLAALPEG